MLKKRLPFTFLDLYKSPNLMHALRLKTALLSAKLFGHWDLPRPNATEDPEEWGFIDEAYGLYKYLRPTTVAEDGVLEAVFANNIATVGLPAEFETDSTLIFGAAGDLMPAEGLEGSQNFYYENVADVLLEVDLSFANLEAPVTQQKIEVNFVGGDSPPLMGFSPAEFPVISGHAGRSFTALSFANNHSMDHGLEGIETTQAAMDAAGIVGIGGHRNLEDCGRATFIERNGIRIGFISATFGLNGFDLPEEEQHRVHVARLSSNKFPPDQTLLRRQIDDCREKGCDFIVASIHWGYECEFFPRQSQVKMAHELVESGVDMILGHHPHVIQPVEYYRPARDPQRTAIIAYSLGGLGFRWYTAPHFCLGLILNMELAKGRVGGQSRTYVSRITPYPVFQNIFMSHLGSWKLKRLEKLDSYQEIAPNESSDRYLSQLRSYANLVLNRRAADERV